LGDQENNGKGSQPRMTAGKRSGERKQSQGRTLLGRITQASAAALGAQATTQGEKSKQQQRGEERVMSGLGKSSLLWEGPIDDVGRAAGAVTESEGNIKDLGSLGIQKDKRIPLREKRSFVGGGERSEPEMKELTGARLTPTET